MAKRDISGMYRQSLLGLLWSLVTPISTAAIWVLLKKSGTVAIVDTNINYVLYVFVGTMAWSIITESILGPINSTIGMKSTLSKINFPKEALILSSVYKTLFNSFIKLLILIPLVLMYHQEINLYIFLFPLTVFVVFLFGTAIGLFITPIGLLYGDISRLLAPVMQILMYISPVVFMNPSLDTLYGKVMYFNPLSPLLNNFRNTILGLEMQQINYYLLISFFSFILFSISLVFYRITIPIITERIS